MCSHNSHFRKEKIKHLLDATTEFFIEHDVCWKTKNSVVECKASENVCENLLDVLGESENLLSAIGLEVGKSPAEVFKLLAAAEYPSHTSSGTARNRVPVF